MIRRAVVVEGHLPLGRGWSIIDVSFNFTCGLRVCDFLISQPISLSLSRLYRFLANNVCKKESYAHHKQIDTSSDESESEESEVDAGQTRSGRAVKRPRKVDYGYRGEESNKKPRIGEYIVTQRSRRMIDDLFSFDPFTSGEVKGEQG